MRAGIIAAARRRSAIVGGGAPLGALVYETTADSASPRTFEVEAYDDGGWFTLASASRLTVPSGVSLVRVVGQTTVTADAPNSCTHQKNGSDTTGLVRQNGQLKWVGAASAPMAVIAGDYFTQVPGSGSNDTAGGQWFAVEALNAATKYALVTKTATQALAAATPTAVTWNSETADTDGWHDNSTNNSRLTVPSGVSRVRVAFGLQSTAFVNTPYFAYIAKNGAAVAGGPAVGCWFGGRMGAASAILEVTAGDYFEAICQTNSGQTINNIANTWFSIEEVPDYARALVRKVATQSVTSAVTTAVAFGTGSEAYDTASIHDEVTNNSRLTVPSGYTRARLTFSLVGANASGGHQVWVRKNGAGAIPLMGLPGFDLDMSGVDYLHGFGAWVSVTAGDYFELMIKPGATMTLPADARTYLSMELV